MEKKSIPRQRFMSLAGDLADSDILCTDLPKVQEAIAPEMNDNG